MIRKALPQDIDCIEAIYERIHDGEESGRTSVGWIRSVYPTRKTAEAAFSRGDLFVGEDGGEIVSVAVINQIQVPEYANCAWQFDAKDEEIMVLHALAVDPQRSGHGYGGEFVRFYEKHAAENGCTCLRMDTNVRNSAARAMYKHLGYREAGVVGCTFNGMPDVKLVCLEKRINNE